MSNGTDKPVSNFDFKSTFQKAAGATVQPTKQKVQQPEGFDFKKTFDESLKKKQSTTDPSTDESATGSKPTPLPSNGQSKYPGFKDPFDFSNQDSNKPIPFFGNVPKPTEKIDLSFHPDKPAQDNVISGQQRQQAQTTADLAKGNQDYLTNTYPQVVKEKADKLKASAAAAPVSATPAFDGIAFMQQDIANNGGTSLKDKPASLDNINQFFDNDATNAARYFNDRKGQIDKQISELRNNLQGQQQKRVDANPVKGDIGSTVKKQFINGKEQDTRTLDEVATNDEINRLNDYKKDLTAAQSLIARKYVAKLYPNASVTEKGKMYDRINGDEAAKEQQRMEDKGIPVTQEQQYHTDIKGLDVDVQQLNDEYAGKPKDDTYYQKLAELNMNSRGLLTKYPEYRKQQGSNLIAQIAIQDPKVKMLAQTGSGNLDQQMVDYISEKYGVDKKDLKGIKYSDIPHETLVGNIIKGVYNAGTSLLTGALRITGTAAGADEDRLTYINKNISESGNDFFGNNPYEKLQQAQTLITNDLQTIANPKAGKYNYNAATIKNAVGDGIGGLVGFIAGTKGVGAAAALTDDAAMTSYLIGSGFENHYQQANDVMGKDANEFAKGLYATGMGYLDALAFKVLPKDKIFFGSAETKAATDQLAKSLEGMSIKNVNREVLEKGFVKVLKAATNTVEETAKIGGAMTIAEMAKTATNLVLGDNKDYSKYLGEGVSNIEGIVKNLPFSMAIPLGLMEIPKGINHSNRFKQTLFDAGQNPETYSATIMQAQGKGLISPEDAAKRIQVVAVMKKVVSTVPETNPETNKPLSQSQQVDYAYNRVKEIALRAKAEEVKDDKPLFDFYNKQANDLVKERTDMISVDVADKNAKALVEKNKETNPAPEVKDETKTLLDNYRTKDPIFKNAKDDELLKMVAQQAQNIGEDGTPHNESGKEMAAKGAESQFGKDLVDAAIKAYPEKDLLKPAEAAPEENPIAKSSKLAAFKEAHPEFAAKPEDNTPQVKKQWDELSMDDKLKLAKENLPDVEKLTNPEIIKVADDNVKMLLDKLQGKKPEIKPEPAKVSDAGVRNVKQKEQPAKSKLETFKEKNPEFATAAKGIDLQNEKEVNAVFKKQWDAINEGKLVANDGDPVQGPNSGIINNGLDTLTDKKWGHGSDRATPKDSLKILDNLLAGAEFKGDFGLVKNTEGGYGVVEKGSFIITTDNPESIHGNAALETSGTGKLNPKEVEIILNDQLSPFGQALKAKHPEFVIKDYNGKEFIKPENKNGIVDNNIDNNKQNDNGKANGQPGISATETPGSTGPERKQSNATPKEQVKPGDIKQGGNKPKKGAGSPEKTKVLKKRAIAQIKSPLYKKALEVESDDPKTQVLQWFIQGGKIRDSILHEIFGKQDHAGNNAKNIEGELRARISLRGKNSPHETVDGLAHHLWDNSSEATQERYDTTDFRNAVEDVLQSHNSKTQMAEEVLKMQGEHLGDHEKKMADWFNQTVENVPEHEEELNHAVGQLEGLSDEQIQAIADMPEKALADSKYLGELEKQYAGEKPYTEEDLTHAQSEVDKANRELKKAQDSFANKQAKQGSLLGGNEVQKDMFAGNGQEVRNVLDPLKQNVREAEARLAEVQKGLEKQPDNQPTLFSIKEPTSQEISDMKDVVKEMVDNGVTDLKDIQKEVAKELGNDSQEMKDFVKKAFDEYGKDESKTEAAKGITTGVIGQVGKYLSKIFGGKASEKVYIARNEKALREKADELGANKFQVSEDVSSVQDALDKYENDQYTVQDIVQHIEDLDIPELKEAVDKFRDEQEYDRELKGRGDMDSANDEFMSAVEKYVADNSKEQPKFMYSPEGEVLGFTHDGKIYLNGEHLNSNTPVHETSHVFLEWSKQNQPEIYNRGMDLVNESPYLKEAQAKKFYQDEANKLPEDQREDYFKHEALATAIGDQGAKFVTEATKSTFKEWLNKLWASVKSALGFKDITPEQLQNLTFDEFTKRAAKDILDNESDKSKTDEVPKSEAPGGTANEPPPETGKAASEGTGSEDFASIRKEKLKEIKGVRELFEKRVPKTWNDVYSSAMANLQKMYPEKSLYDAMKARVDNFLLKLHNKELYNPTSEDIAVFNVFRAQTGEKIKAVKGQDSTDTIVRQAANAELRLLHQDLINISQVTNPEGEAGRAFGMHQSEVALDPDYGLKIRRMQLMDANGGEPLSAKDEQWAKDMWEQEKENMKKEQEVREQGMKEDFDNRISELQKEYEGKLKNNSGTKDVSAASKEKTLSQKGKAIADKIRKLKKPKDSTNIDFTLGTWDIAVEGIAKLVEAGSTIAEAIEKVVKDGIVGFKEQKDRDAFENHISDSLSVEKTKEDYLQSIKDFATENDVNDITKEMVGKNLIRDYVDSHIGEVEQKDLLDVATNDLKEILPDVTKEKLIEAYLKENDFKQPTRRDVEGGIAEAKKQLKSIAKATEDIEDLENLKKIRQRNFPTEREKSDYEKQLLDEKDAKIKEINDRNNQIREDNRKLESERDRQLKKVQELKDKKDKLENGIIEKKAKADRKLDTPEIEGLKNQVRQIETEIRIAESARKAAEKKIENDRNRQIKSDNKKLETEINRQMNRIAELNDKKDKLENGIREKRTVNKNVDTPEIEALKEQVKEADKNLREAESAVKKSNREIQARKDKIDELNANIERAKNDRDLIKTHRDKTESEIDDEIAAKQKELKKAVEDNTSEDRVQAKKLESVKENTRKKIEEFQRKLDEGEFEEKIPVELKKADAELIRLKKKQSVIEEAYRKKQNEFQEKNKSGKEKAADLIRAGYVALLIGRMATLAKVASMSVLRPLSETTTKLSFGKAFDAFFPGISKVALRGGESSSIRSIQKGFEAYFRQMGDKKIDGMYQKAETEFAVASKAYRDYKASFKPDATKLQDLKDNMNNKLIKAQGSFIYKFIGGSSIKDALSAFVNRSNEIEKQFGKVEGEGFEKKDLANVGGTSFLGLDANNMNYVMGFVGRSHSAAKTFSGRFSFAAGFMARLEGAVRNGEDISTGDKILEIAHESYLDWERGKYQQYNDVTHLWNKMTNHLSEGETGTPREGTAKVMAALLKTEVAITRVPVNILHEAVMEYTLGVFKALAKAAKVNKEIKKQLTSEGFTNGEKIVDGITTGTSSVEFKAALRERINQMDEKQAATIARCFRKGGLGVGLYAFALISAGIHFGIFPHFGQKKKKDEKNLGPDELNPGQVMFGHTKMGEVTSGIIEHIPALWTTFMGLGMAQAYKDKINKGKSTVAAVEASLYTHLKIVEGGIPQFKLVQPLQEEIVRTVGKRLESVGLKDKK